MSTGTHRAATMAAFLWTILRERFRHRHERTDPACRLHRAPRTAIGRWHHNRNWGLACPECVGRWRTIGYMEDKGIIQRWDPPNHVTNSERTHRRHQ